MSDPGTALATADPGAAPSDSAPTGENAPPPLVLIVDDDSISRRILRDALAPVKATLVFAQDGQEALALAEMHRPDLVLLDLMMPELDGFQVIERLRLHVSLSDVPVIVLSAYGDRENRLRGLRAGADDFVTKPFDREELRVRVTTACRLGRARRLADARERFEQLITQSPDGIALLDHTWHVMLANDSLRAMVPARLRGLLTVAQGTAPVSFLSLVARTEEAMVRTALAELELAPSTAGRFETLLAGSPPVPVEIAAVRGIIAGRAATTLMVRDIRQHRRVQSALHTSEAMEGVGPVAVEVAHDVAALLDVIQQQQLALAASTTNAEALATVQQALTRARHLTGTLLRYGRTASGAREMLHAAQFLREQVPFLSGLLPPGITLAVDTPDPLPPISIDSASLGRAMLNLVLNARNALGGEGQITLRAIPADGGVEIAVTDTGPGFDAAIVARFATAGATTRAHDGGSGLGLASVRRLVEANGGRLSLSTEQYAGTCVRLWLPATR
jgi:DNA-binding response OmpR family regulator/two-component sensor histidine kinase